ncbi:MAG: N-acetylmuramoyl-L-alanine amidase [Desulfotomaculum sp.]|nr:N-acetylmuramoyl-L-alanine amidase [Desulfotomaculum sp.]MCL0080867.1 N-acetylmuramoyl-L-alanine amidase [Peptococcaceae bacterium]
MKIIETNLQFKELNSRTTMIRIIIHHSAGSGNETAATIHKFHLSQGWSGIGYHYVIKKAGTIERGRPEGMVGAHARRQGNWNSIGICVAGHFSVNEPTPAQMKALVWLINDIENRYKKQHQQISDLEIVGHNQVTSTECPGRLFPWDKLRTMLQEIKMLTGVKLTINHRPVEVSLRLVNGRSEVFLSGHWVQLRELAEIFLAQIEWDPATRTVNLIIK